MSSRCEVKELKGQLESLVDKLNAVSSAIAEAHLEAAAAGRAAELAQSALAAGELSLAQSQRAEQDALEEAERWRQRAEALAEKHDRLSRVVQVSTEKHESRARVIRSD